LTEEDLEVYEDYVVLIDEVHLLLDWIIEKRIFLNKEGKFLFRKMIGMTATMEDTHKAKIESHSAELNCWVIDATIMVQFDGTKTIVPILRKNKDNLVNLAIDWLKRKEETDETPLPSIIFFDDIEICNDAVQKIARLKRPGANVPQSAAVFNPDVIDQTDIK
jgi:hypothetical protein